ncbi:MAG: Ku protein [Pseudomonadota bacterium]
MAPRAYWKGYLKLALVSCPVKLYSATASGSKISFNQLHKDTMNRVQMKYHDPELGEIDRADLVKGYQFEKDKYVIVDKEELDAIQIESNKTIEIEGFIDADEVDDLYLDAPYFLGPDGPIAEETYAVVREALARASKVAIARIVLSGRERLITLRPYGEGFLLTTLRSKDEVRDASKYFDPLDISIDEDLLQMAEMIIKQKEMSFDPSSFEDRYETALMDLIKAKIAGKEPVVSKAPEQGKVINLMDALKASIDEDRRPAAASKPKAAPKSKPAAKAKPAPKTRSRKTAS